jgi:hypothetical protein
LRCVPCRVRPRSQIVNVAPHRLGNALMCSESGIKVSMPPVSASDARSRSGQLSTCPTTSPHSSHRRTVTLPLCSSGTIWPGHSVPGLWWGSRGTGKAANIVSLSAERSRERCLLMVAQNPCAQIAGSLESKDSRRCWRESGFLGPRGDIIRRTRDESK